MAFLKMEDIRYKPRFCLFCPPVSSPLERGVGMTGRKVLEQLAWPTLWLALTGIYAVAVTE